MLSRHDLHRIWTGRAVPWNGSNCFTEDACRRDVEKCYTTGVSGVYTDGSTGEFYAIEFDEFQTIIPALLSFN